MNHILITGSTDGIGKLTAIQLAQKGHKIYLHGRNAEKLTAVIKEVEDATGNRNIEGFVADFSNLKEVENMADKILSKLPWLDVVINNAGIFNSTNNETSAGLDVRFAVNYFAPYILSNALLPLLKKSDTPRIINLSSAAQSPVSLDALQGKTALAAQPAYAQSKLALTMWSTFLAQKEQDILVIPVNPSSLLNTKMVKEAFGQFVSSTDKGADILTKLATNNNLTDKSGEYFDNDQGFFSKAHQDAYDPVKIKNLLATTDLLLSNHK